MKRKWILAGLVLGLMVVAAQAQGPSQKKTDEVFKNVKVLTGIPSDQLLPTMQFFEASLGVTCDFCHEQQRERDTKMKDTARKMIAMVRTINATNFDATRRVSCYTCHNGRTRPEANPALAEANYKPWNPDGPNVAEAARPVPGPPAEQLIDKLVKSLGGISNASSIVRKGTITDSLARNIPFELTTKGDSTLYVLHNANGDATQARTGDTGWVRAGNGAARDIRLDELDTLKMLDGLALARSLKNLTKLETRTVRQDGTEVYQIRGVAFGHLPVRINVGKETGSPQRVVWLVDNAIGENVNRVDFSDFRDMQGGRVPFRRVYARPLGYQMMKIEQYQLNAQVDDSRFARPAVPAR